jgi:hypothetical protein
MHFILSSSCHVTQPIPVCCQLPIVCVVDASWICCTVCISVGAVYTQFCHVLFYVCGTPYEYTVLYVCRSEMDLPEVSVRFGLMLEAYCRGCGSYRDDLTKQFAALDAMRQISSSLQKAVSGTCKLIAFSTGRHVLYACTCA